MNLCSLKNKVGEVKFGNEVVSFVSWRQYIKVTPQFRQSFELLETSPPTA